MVDLSKPSKHRLGVPPSPEEASTALREPETAPAPVAPVPELEKKIDARTLRKTGRTVQFATRVSPEFDRRFRAIAKRERLLLAQLLELALEAYEKQSRNK